MTTDKPPVIIIRIKDDPMSEKLAKETKESWERFGHATEFFDAITPNDLGDDRYMYLDFGDKILPHKRKYRLEKNAALGLESSEDVRSVWEPRTSIDGKSYTRVISETEQSVYYSHIELWKLISKRNVPHIVVEHDMALEHNLSDNLFDRFLFYQFGEGLCHCSYITPLIVNKLLEGVKNYNPAGMIAIDDLRYRSGLLNVDGYLWRLLTNIIYEDNSLHDKMYFRLGNTVEKLSYMEEFNYPLYNNNDYGKMVRDISRSKDGYIIYATIDHENLYEVVN